MKLFNRRLLGIALAIVFCLGATLVPTNFVAAQEDINYTVKVGLYAKTTTDSRFFSANTKSETGFEVGYISANGFVPLFPISQTEIIILPNTNASFNAENGKVTDTAGNIGAYSTIYSHYTSYGRALTKARGCNGFVAVVSDGFQVRANPCIQPDKTESKTLAQPVENGITLLDSNGNIILVWADSSRNLALRGKNGGSVNLPMRHRSGSVYRCDYLGSFEYSVQDGKLFMINHINIEDYTKCVMSNEIGTNASVETRKAFSVLVRTVPLGQKHKKLGFDVCSHSACCQVYKGLERISEENNEIVDSTKGQYCAYEGDAISVLYHNSNGGASCSSVAAWGGDEVPYLTTVFVDEAGESDYWELSFTKEEFCEYITSRSAFSDLSGDGLSMQIIETDPYGSDYITLLSVSDDMGNCIEVHTSEDIRSACGFDSANFKLEYTATAKLLTADGVQSKTVNGVMTKDGYKTFTGFDDVYLTADGSTLGPDRVTIKGQGAGHGVGFSAIGSEALAADGYSYKYILGFFFNGTRLLTLG